IVQLYKSILQPVQEQMEVFIPLNTNNNSKSSQLASTSQTTTKNPLTQTLVPPTEIVINLLKKLSKNSPVTLARPVSHQEFEFLAKSFNSLTVTINAAINVLDH